MQRRQVVSQNITDLNGVTYRRFTASYLTGTDKPTNKKNAYDEDFSKYSQETYEYDSSKRKTKETFGDYTAAYSYGANDIVLTLSTPVIK